MEPLLVKLMVAFNVTVSFTNEVLGDDVRVIVVPPAPTTWASAVAPEALPVKLVSPLV